jgi:hypothetical protein
MLTQKDLERKLKELKPIVHQKYFVDKLGYFGSYSRNLQHKDSDVDVLVTLSKPLGWEFFDLKKELEDHLDAKVDLVTENALKAQIKDRILNSVKYV